MQSERHAAGRRADQLKRLAGSNADAVLLGIEAQAAAITVDFLNDQLAGLAGQHLSSDNISTTLYVQD